MEVCKQNELCFYLGLLQEEAAEVIQIVNKNKRFGLTEQYPQDIYNNKERMEHEMKDLITVAKILEDQFDMDFGIGIKDEDYEKNKTHKINKYKEYTIGLGFLEEG